MKLIGAGLPRTGTLSQKVALEMAGLGPCYHMVNVLGDLSLATQWRDAVEGRPDWESIFEGFQSSVDWPGSYFWRELTDRYPDAKVLLSVRDGEAWEQSMRNTIWGVLYGECLMRDVSRARARVDEGWRGYIELMCAMWEGSGLVGPGGVSEPGEMARAMERHNQLVIDTVPEERLLVWSVSEGWEPLCEFLGIEQPSAPFPRLNDGAQFSDRIVDGALLSIGAWRQAAQETVQAV